MRYAFIERHRSEHCIVTMCRVLEASKAGYYTWRKNKPGARAQSNSDLLSKIKTYHNESRKTYGSPRITADLHAEGLR